MPRGSSVTLRMVQDNVLILMDPPESKTASGLHIVHTRAPGAREHRTATVYAVGSGHHDGCKACGGPRGAFIPTQLKPGDRIIVDAVAGQKYDLDVSAVRTRPKTEFEEIAGQRGDWRVIRESEALCVIEEEQAAE